MMILTNISSTSSNVIFIPAGFAAGLGVHLQELLATAPEKFTLHMKVDSHDSD